MPVMFCYIDPFVLNQQVVRLTPGNTEVVFSGGLEAACNFMAAEYRCNEYSKIALKGVLAESVAERIQDISTNLFNSDKKIKIEVLQ